MIHSQLAAIAYSYVRVANVCSKTLVVSINPKLTDIDRRYTYPVSGQFNDFTYEIDSVVLNELGINPHNVIDVCAYVGGLIATQPRIH